MVKSFHEPSSRFAAIHSKNMRKPKPNGLKICKITLINPRKVEYCDLDTVLAAKGITLANLLRMEDRESGYRFAEDFLSVFSQGRSVEGFWE